MVLMRPQEPKFLLSGPMWIMLLVVLIAVIVELLRDGAYYFGFMEFPLGDGTPSRWIGR